MSNLFDPFVDQSIKDNDISHSYSDKVMSDVAIDHTTPRWEYLSNSLSDRKARWLLIVLFCGMVILGGRVGQLQIAEGSTYREQAEGNRIRIEYLPAARGVITDRNGTSLVKNIPNFTVTITPSSLPEVLQERQSVLQRTANILETSLVELEATLDEHSSEYYNQPLQLQEYVEYDRALILSAELSQLPGVEITVNSSREYKNPEAFAHVLGYLGKLNEEEFTDSEPGEYLLTDETGKNGLEWQYENELKGIKGKQRVEVDARGNQLEVIAKDAATPGTNLVLAIDAELQETLYAGLEQASNELNTPGGAAVAIDPNTGHIRALVSYPGFDINAFTRGVDQEYYDALLNDERKPFINKAIQGEYPSGSTFKLVVAAAALQEQVVQENTTVLSNGGVQINKWYFPDWKAGGHGTTDVRKAIAESVNTFFYLAGGGAYNEETLEIEGGLGIERLNTYAQRFGLNQVNGIDLPGAADGFLPTPDWKEEAKQEQWYIGDTYNASIGQGDVLVTPLQVALFTSAVANGGNVHDPQLVEWLTTQSGDSKLYNEPSTVASNIVNSYYLQVVREGMRSAVLDGSAVQMQALPVTSAGKTGTAQASGTDRTHSWYTTFAPYEDPEVVLTVLVEEGGEGSGPALSIAREALTGYFTE